MDPNIRERCKKLCGPQKEELLHQNYAHDLDEYIYMVLKEQNTHGHKCAKCKGNECTIELMQTRSADEGMTAFILCPNCRHKRLFS